MRKLSFLLAFLFLSTLLFSQEQKEQVKTGFNFGPLPAVGYSSDLGWHYGALLDTYYYGDGSVYPDYKWMAKVEASWYSKGNSVYHLFYDSKYLIPGIRFSGAISYFGNKTTQFFGFNGAHSVYVPELDRIVNGQGFYLMRRDIFRIATCFQGQFGDSHWSWAGGLSYYNIKTGHAENKGLAGYDKKTKTPATDLSLYDLYVSNGIIPAAEAKGGQHLEAKFGVVYDTRDHENNPSRGTNLEVYFYGSPDIISHHNNSYLKLAVHFKQFFTLVPDRLVFGGHLAYQGLIAGNQPYYMLQTIQCINMKQNNTEGLGSTCTLRGTAANRLQGNSYAWSNFELRWSFARFRLFKQNFILALNPFFDMGKIVKRYHTPEMSRLATGPDSEMIVAKTDTQVYKAKDFYNSLPSDKLHMGAGAGLHVIMNQNFNINFEFGKCFDKNDGTALGINIGLNYIF